MRTATCEVDGHPFKAADRGVLPKRCREHRKRPGTPRAVRPSVRPSVSRESPADIVAQARAWRSSGEALRDRLAAERDRCEARVREIDQVLAELDAAAVPPPRSRRNGTAKGEAALPLDHPRVRAERGIPDGVPAIEGGD